MNKFRHSDHPLLRANEFAKAREGFGDLYLALRKVGWTLPAIAVIPSVIRVLVAQTFSVFDDGFALI